MSTHSSRRTACTTNLPALSQKVSHVGAQARREALALSALRVEPTVEVDRGVNLRQKVFIQAAAHSCVCSS
jgi:hypothetical protein